MSMTIEQAANQIALSKLSADPNARGMLTPGIYPINTTVKVVGQIKVGEDSEYTPTVSIPLKETLALFIKYCGATREAAIAALVKAMQDSLAVDGKGQGALIEAMPILEQTMATVEATLAKLPKQPRKGAVTCKLQTEVVEAVSA